MFAVFSIKLLDYELVRNLYDNAITSGLSILGIKDDGGWKEATEFIGLARDDEGPIQ